MFLLLIYALYRRDNSTQTYHLGRTIDGFYDLKVLKLQFLLSQKTMKKISYHIADDLPSGAIKLMTSWTKIIFCLKARNYFSTPGIDKFMQTGLI